MANIFCQHNIIWGLARMKANRGLLGQSLFEMILKVTMEKLHTFHVAQMGDLMWAIGTLGYKKSDLSSEECVGCDRLCAVLGRMYSGLSIRATAYVLWGLAKVPCKIDFFLKIPC